MSIQSSVPFENFDPDKTRAGTSVSPFTDAVYTIYVHVTSTNILILYLSIRVSILLEMYNCFICRYKYIIFVVTYMYLYIAMKPSSYPGYAFIVFISAYDKHSYYACYWHVSYSVLALHLYL